MWFCTETVKIVHAQLNSNKKATKIMHLHCSFLVKIVEIFALLVCKIVCPKIRSCKFFWQISSLDDACEDDLHLGQPNSGGICDDDNYLGQLVTETRVQGGETALWSKWDTSTTTLKYHHLRHLWRFQWKHYSDTLQNCGVNIASWWVLLNLSTFWFFLLICKVPLYYEN